MWEGRVCIYDIPRVFNNFPQRLAKWRWQRRRGPFTSKFCSSFFYFIFIFFFWRIFIFRPKWSIFTSMLGILMWWRRRGPFTSKFCSSFFYFSFIFFSSRFLFSSRNDWYSPVRLVYSGIDQYFRWYNLRVFLYHLTHWNEKYRPIWYVINFLVSSISLYHKEFMLSPQKSLQYQTQTTNILKYPWTFLAATCANLLK